MKHEVIHFIEGKENVTLTTYYADNINDDCDALLILPGGGYGFVCMDREGDSSAMIFASLGMKVFVLNYSVLAGAKFPAPLVEASLAMYYIKSHATEYGINPERVFVLGFSAGGHLAAALGTLWHKVWRDEKLPIPEGANRPCGMILSYPVISWFEGTHKGTFYNAMGRENFTEEEVAPLCLDKQVDADTVPAFIWHTADDGSVSVDNSLRFCQALCKQGVYTEMHIFPHGPHGLATATRMSVGEKESNERIARWPYLAHEWTMTVSQ